jgi:hypothetical protein
MDHWLNGAGGIQFVPNTKRRFTNIEQLFLFGVIILIYYIKRNTHCMIKTVSVMRA